MISAPACAGMRMKMMLDESTAAPITKKPTDTSSGDIVVRPCHSRLRWTIRAASPTPTLCESCCIIAAKLVVRLIRCVGMSAYCKAWRALNCVDRENPPMRACLGVDLEPPHLVEIVVTAAKR